MAEGAKSGPPRRRTSIFVGRGVELDEVCAGFDEAGRGRGQLFLVVGEPGIGKTRLADEVADYAAANGARVLWGRSWESGGAPAFWPWVQVLRSCIEGIDGSQRSALLAAFAEELSDLVPELRDPRATSSEKPEGDPEQARFRLFDAVTRTLRSVAMQVPLVLLLEDLHAADQPSLLLLRFLARELRGARLLVLGTYRELEASRNPAVGPLLAEVAREGHSLTLRGLDRSDVETFLRNALTTPPDDALIDAVFRATEGNPLFLTEVARLVDRRGNRERVSSIPVPDHVRAVIRQRLALLPEEARRILALAAVIGREFEAPVLETLLPTQSFAVRPTLEEAETAGLVTRLPSTLARWTFSHLLLRDTLYEDLPASERADLHRRIGAALEVFYAGDLQPHLAEIAHHFVLGADAETSDAALDYAERAGHRAQSMLAYEEAASHFEKALQVLDLRRVSARRGDARRRVELQLALGDALWGVRDLVSMRAAFAQAAESARTLPRPDAGPLLATAALGFGGRQQRAHVAYEQPVVDLLEEALRLLPAEDHPLRARAMARLAYATYSQPDSYERRVQLCRDAVAMARRIGDPVTLRWVLNDWRWALWGPDTIEERLQIAAELVDLADRAGDREMSMNEHSWRLVDLLELGDIAAVEAELDIYKRAAYQMRLPWYQEYVARFSAMRGLLQGQFEEAERQANSAMGMAQGVHRDDTALLYGTQLLALRIEQGRLAEMEAGLQVLMAQYPAVPIWRAFTAWMHLKLKRVDEARAEFDRVAARNFTDVPRDHYRIPCLMYLADVCFLVGDRQRAQLLYDLLAPYASRCVIVGFGLVCWGAVARSLGGLAATMGRWDIAKRDFEVALSTHARLHARPAYGRTQAEYAQALLAQSTDNTPQARALTEEAAATAEALGMKGLATEARELLERMAAAAVSPPAMVAPAPTVTPVAAAVFRQQGDVWTMSFEGTSVQMKDLLGFTYVSHLLRYPDREFHVLDLVSLVGGAVEDGDAMALGGDSGEVLDHKARSAYRERLRDLQSELVQAESDNDLGRMTNLRAEMDVLSDELIRASGLGGRARRSGSVAERARVNVTKRVGIAMRRIASHHESLARYLTQTIKTGTFCSYSPDPRRRIDWNL